MRLSSYANIRIAARPVLFSLCVVAGDEMDLQWAVKPDGEWFSLDESLQHVGLHSRGVYIIWIPSPAHHRPATPLKVGSGNLTIRLALERTDPYVYKSPYPALVTWAEVDARHHLGLVRYLIQLLEPVLWDHLPEVEPIPVELPLRA
jgi:hypothetical protein